MRIVSSEISISEKVGNNPFPAFLYFQRFAAAFAQVAQVSRHLPGVCAGCAGLAAFTGAAGEKCAEARDCLRRALVSVGTEERFLERLKKTSMNEFSPDKSANILSLMENFTEID